MNIRSMLVFLTICLINQNVIGQEIFINEVASLNTTSVVDDYGEYDDWVELYNPGKKQIDLAGYYLSDDASQLDRWKFPANKPWLTVLPPNSYLVLWADRDTLQGDFHLPFRLSQMGEILILSKIVGDKIVSVDSVSFGNIPKNESFGRCPDSKMGWKVMKVPSPGTSNNCREARQKTSKDEVPKPQPPFFESKPTASFTTGQNLKINEIIARNAKGFTDEFGDDDDWIELYNPGTTAVNIAGLYMSDTILATSFHRIPNSNSAKTTIPAGGYIVLWADGETAEGPNHLPFKLSNGGETVYLAQLIAGQVSIIDQVTFPKMERDVPYGRLPNGTGSFKRLSDPSPGAANKAIRIISNAVINEVMAVNTGQDTDEYGEAEDWIEFYNPGTAAVDLGGAYLTDSVGELTMHRIPIYAPDSTTIPAGGYLRFWADNNPKQGIRHLDFKLSRNGEKITLTQADGMTIMQQAQYPAASSDASFGQYPDGSNNWIYLNIPTPVASNRYNYEPINGIVINEILASNESYYPDNLGEIEDLIELYNTNDFPVDVGGLLITDSLQNPLAYRIPANSPDSTTIPAKGFLVFWADNDPEQGIWHLDIKLAASGESVGLAQYRESAVYLDTHTFSLQTPNVSIGKFPDGTGQWQEMKVPTPGTANSVETDLRITGLYINEILARNTNNYPDEDGLFTDWIEIYNITNSPIDLGGLFLTDDLTNPQLFQVPDTDPQKTTVLPKSYLIFRPDANAAKGALHTNFQLAGAGEQVGLFQQIGDEFMVIDSISYGPQEENISFGRSTDAGTEWTLFETPTPATKNQKVTEQISGLFINELMARNSTTIADEHGNFVDWIELYNSNNATIDLAGLYFTDDVATPRKSMVPIGQAAQTSIPGKSYIVFWPDANPDLGARHLDFQLAGAGEAVYLYQQQGSELLQIDAISFPVQTNDVSYGRVSDGASDWQYFTTPTPLASNSGSGIFSDHFQMRQGILVYPNPATDELNLSFDLPYSGLVSWELFSLQGKLLAKGQRFGMTNQMIHLGSLDSLNLMKKGYYLIRVFTNDVVYTSRFLVSGSL